MSTSELERRFLPRARGEVRSTTKAGRRGIAGTAAVIGSRSEVLGDFVEEIAEGAFDKALKKSDIRGLFNHSPNYVLGRQKSGTMRVWADKRGLHYEIPKLPESRADVAEAIERGDVDGCSFSFVVAPNGQSWRMENGTRVRTITEFAEILDCGPVTMPAYAATTVSARTLAQARRHSPSLRSSNALEQEKLLLAELEQDIGL